jgi:hypothetical protein
LQKELSHKQRICPVNAIQHQIASVQIVPLVQMEALLFIVAVNIRMSNVHHALLVRQESMKKVRAILLWIVIVK